MSLLIRHSHVWLFATPWTAARQTSLSFTISRSLFKLMAIELVMLSNQFILNHPLLLPPSIFPSFRVFSRESVLRIRWPMYWSFSFSISCSNESIQDWFPLGWTGLISLQSKGLSKIFSNTTIQKHQFFWCSAFFRKWQPTPAFLPGESQGRGSLVGCRLWGCTELDTTEAT